MVSATASGQRTADQKSTSSSDQSSEARSSAHEPYINVPSNERWISGLSGAALVLAGLKMRSIPGAVLVLAGGAMTHRAWTGHCNVYGALGINRAQGEGAGPEDYSSKGIHVSQAITIDKSPEELYRYWRDFQNLPRFMNYLEDVQILDDKRSHWKAKAPAGMSVEWDAEIINDQPNETIAWRSLYPASVDSAGSVRFVAGPPGRGTEVRVTFDYIPPAGKAGWMIAKLFGKDPEMEVREDLRRFKQIMETGEIPALKGQPHGKRGLKGSIMATD